MDCAVRVGKGVVRVLLGDGLVLGKEVMQRDDSGDGWRQRGGNPGVAHIGEVGRAVDGKIVNLSMKRAAHLAGSAAEVDHQSGRRDAVDGKAALPEPCGDGIDVCTSNAKVRGELLRGKPLVKVWRPRVAQLRDVLRQSRFGVWRSLQQELHMSQREIVCDRAKIVCSIGLGANVAS